MPLDVITTAFEQILELAKEKGKRSDKILKVLNAIGIKQDAPPANDFDGVYAYTLVVYGIDKPKPILEFFRHQFIKSAFRQSFETRDPSYLEEESENFLDWSPIAKELFSTMDYDPRQEFAGFREQFIAAAKLTRTVHEVIVDHTLEDIQVDIQELPTLEEIHTELFPLDQKLDQLLEIVAEQGKSKKVVPFILPQLNISNFTGRDSELEKLEEQIFSKDGSRIVGIAGVTGTGGMGKSALAFHFAYKHKDEFPDGIIGLRIDSDSVDAVAQRFASYVGIKPEGLKNLSAAEIMQSVFRPLRALLIFDNAEETTAKALRPGGDLCAVIVTTRNKGLLRSLDIPETAHLDLERFDYEDTKELLDLLVGKERIEAEEEAVKEVYKLVGGLPLALRIVGGTLTDQPFTPITDYAADLQKAKLDLLKDLDDKDLDVRASFSLSLKFLSESQIDLFAYLGVCAPEGFSLQTIQVVSEQPLKDVRGGLARFVRLSLLNEGSDLDRFVLHPLLFDFAEELAKKKNLYDLVEERHTKYFIEYADKHRGLQIENLGAIEGEINSLILTAYRLLEHEKVNYGFYVALEPFFQVRGYWTKALELIDLYSILAVKIRDWHAVIQFLLQRGQFLQIMGKVDDAENAFQDALNQLSNIDNNKERDRLEAMVLNSLGGMLQRAGRLDDAVNILQRGVVLEESLGREHGQAIVLNSLGSAFQRQSKFDEAIASFQRAYGLLVKQDDQRGQAMVLNSQGGVFQRLGRFEDSIEAFQKSHKLLVQLGDVHGQAMVLNSLGGAYQRQGSFDKAIEVFQQSHELLMKLRDERGQAMVLNSLGGAFQRQGKFDEAIQIYKKSADIEERLGNKRGQAMVLNSLGGALQRQGKFDEAIEIFKKSVTIEEQLKNRRGQAMVLNSVGGVQQRKGNFAEASKSFEKSYDLLVELGDERGQAMVLNSFGGILQRQGRFDEAIDAFQKSAVIEERLGNQRGQAMVLNSLGGVLQRQGKFDEAVDAFQQSYAISERLEDDRSLAMVLNSLGVVLQRQGKFDEAVEKLKQAQEISEKLNNEITLAMVLNSLGVVLQRQGKFDEAMDAFQQSYKISEKLRDERSLMMVLNSLAVVLQRKGNLEEAIKYFQESIKIGERLNNSLHLAIAHFSLGRAFLEHNQPANAKNELKESFEIHEKLKNPEGMRSVTPSLIRALNICGEKTLAKEYVNRALVVAPKDRRLLRLMEQIMEDRQVSNTIITKPGRIKKTVRNLAGYLYGFIVPDDNSGDIYFGQDQVDEKVIPKLAEGLSVWAEVEMAARGPRARRVWVKE